MQERKPTLTETQQDREGNLFSTVCKSRWNNIRDRYRKFIKNTATKSGQRRESQKHYKYHEQLSFLRPYFQERETISNISAQSEDSTLDTDLNSGSPHSAQSPSVLSDEEVIISIPSPVHTSHRTGSLSPAASSSSLASAQETTDKPKSAAATLLEYVLKKNQNNTTEEHPIDKFLHGIASTLKNLTPYYQNLAKSDTFNIVQKYEINMFERHMEVRNVENDVQIIFETSTPSAGKGRNLQVQEELPEITHPSPSTSTSAPMSMQGESVETETLSETFVVASEK
ncbi:uncharacterized protein LOC126966635 [Leptidea sinapis]|uniref:uncharacterized protein LOC126966635 n=1 Tax=Leptidea sinapis TaxID=189913 RepID=UPI0021C3B9A2|nr:uncharacterized protein LOC126966635 [Leptidea sinapis]